MIVDTSAVLAIVLEEPEARAFGERILGAADATISAGSIVELAAVATRRFGGRLDARIDLALEGLDLRIAAVTPAQAIIARDAYRRYGIGTHHPAGLDFGNCFSYALAKDTGLPLLFKGEDFIHTDIRRAT